MVKSKTIKRSRAADPDDDDDLKFFKSKSGGSKKRELLVLDNGSAGIDNMDDFEESSDEDNKVGRKALFGMKSDSDDDEEDLNDASEAMAEDESSDDENRENEKVEKLTPKSKRETTEYKQRLLLLSSRGVSYRHRHLLQDFNALLPHSKKDTKLDDKGNFGILNELSELSNCNNCIYFEARRHQDLYMWISKTPNGPSVKFHVEDIHTMDELKMIGNCLKGSRPILSFDKTFDLEPRYQILKEILTHGFSTPRTSRKIKPFIDHVFTFSVAEDRIWFRNFQIVEKEEKTKEIELVEIGPRFVLHLVRIFDGSFGGSTLYNSPSFVPPHQVRQMLQRDNNSAYIKRTSAQAARNVKMEDAVLPEDPLKDIFK
ncbi:Ribosome biogenesis protein brx1 [Nowakowskiella sp. JEL0078]|nr:Ribosome biogenesis protein brx1 [Nowakowskiella sp. JEL0078]